MAVFLTSVILWIPMGEEFFRNLKKILTGRGFLCTLQLECEWSATMKKGRDKVTIKIPRPLYENLGKIIEGGGFSCVTEFIVYVLRDLIASRSVEKEPGLTREEIGIIRKRLKSLHYL